jgi:hypothetical protein
MTGYENVATKAWYYKLPLSDNRQAWVRRPKRLR